MLDPTPLIIVSIIFAVISLCSAILREDVRIAVQTIPYSKNPALLLELEAIILRATEPPYNVQIPMES